MNRWTILSAVTGNIGVEWRDISMIDEERKYLMFNTKNGHGLYDAPLNIAGYTTFYTITSYSPGETLDVSK
jgi:hypothetical protein